MEYHRPESLEEALSLLEHGIPMGGGTRLVPRRRELDSVIDLSELGLDGLLVSEDTIDMGATLSLQAIVEADDRLPAALIQTARLEAGWNIRNQATVGGTILSGGGRSPLLTVLLALESEVEVHPGPSIVKLSEIHNRPDPHLVTSVRFAPPLKLLYEQVARSPADRPVVCAAVAVAGDRDRVVVALGGFESRTSLLSAENVAEADGAMVADELRQAANKAYRGAADAWASAEYRSAVAGVITRRLVLEAMT